jgi:hypothetical protein
MSASRKTCVRFGSSLPQLEILSEQRSSGLKRRLFTGLAAATTVAASLLITAVTPAAAQT